MADVEVVREVSELEKIVWKFSYMSLDQRKLPLRCTHIIRRSKPSTRHRIWRDETLYSFYAQRGSKQRDPNSAELIAAGAQLTEEIRAAALAQAVVTIKVVIGDE